MVSTDLTPDTEASDAPAGSLHQAVDAFLRRARPKGTIRGLAAGGVATVVMTCFRAPVSRSPPPPAWLWRRYIDEGDDNPDRTILASAFLHLLYGIIAGGVFGALVGSPTADESESKSELSTTLFGLLYAGALSVFGDVVLLEWFLRLDLDTDERFVFHVGHAVYGLTLGTWFGAVD